MERILKTKDLHGLDKTLQCFQAFKPCTWKGQCQHGILMFEMWKEERVVVLEPHEDQLPLQWMQRHHEWHHVYVCIHCHGRTS